MMIEQHGTLEISRSRLRHNLGVLRARMGGVEGRPIFCSTVKANAYGHGVREVVGILREEGVRWGCVYGLEEVEEVLKAGMGEVLVLSPVVLDGAVSRELLERLARVHVNVTDLESARRLSAAMQAAGLAGERRVRVHVQVDAGLTRAGALPEEALAICAGIGNGELAGLELEGIFAHLSHGDVPGHESVGRQLGVLRGVAKRVKMIRAGVMVHLQNSGGVMHGIGEVKLDMVRVGIAMYGLQPSMEFKVEGLLPIARLVAPVVAIHERPAGTGVGYGHTFVTKRASRLAIVPVGYAEGYPRGMSNRGVVQVGAKGVEAPAVGRVSMDQIVVDVTDVAGVRVGDRVVMMSWEVGARNSVDVMAEGMGTIGYEVATGWGGRLRRTVVE